MFFLYMDPVGCAASHMPILESRLFIKDKHD